MSSHCDPVSIYRSQRLGLNGFIDKQTSMLSELRSAIAAIDAGGSYFSPRVRELQQKQKADPLAFFKLLTDKQQQILTRIGDLRSDAEIGVEFGFSSSAAEKHRFRIMRQLGITCRSKLQRYAIRTGLTRFISGAD